MREKKAMLVTLVGIVAALLLVRCAAEAEAQTHTPRGQAVLFIAPEGMNCPPCPVLIADLKSWKGCAVATEDNPHVAIVDGEKLYPHYVIRRGVPGMSVPTFVFFDDDGKRTGTHVGYRCFKDGELLPHKDRLNELRRIMRKHPMYRATKPPPAPPVEEASVASLSAPVRTADLVTLANDGTVTIPEAQAASPEIQTVQYMPYADCSGSQAQAFAMPYSDCGGGGGIGGGGGDYFTPPAQSMYAPQYGLSYAQPYIAQYVPRQYQPQQYVVRYVPRATMPQFTGGGINNWSLINIQPQLGLGLGGLFSQRAYYAPRRSYRAAYSPFSFASYSRPVSYGSRMVCGPNGCVMY